MHSTTIMKRVVFGTALFLLLCGAVLAQPSQATNPSPAPGATNVATNVTLSWTDGGGGTTGYYVYLGTDTSYNGGAPVHTGPESTYDASVNPSPLPSPLAAGTKYYWRIDPYDGLGNTTTGVDWSFTTASGGSGPSQAINPTPANGATGVATNVTLTWQNGGGATNYTVYLGTSATALTQVHFGPETSYDASTNPLPLPSPLAAGTQYFWRIDPQDGSGNTTTGAVWNFTTAGSGGAPAQPTTPNPSTGATGVSPNVTLTWANGGGTVVDYNVWLGTSAVGMVQVASGPGLTYATTGLTTNTQYFWRVDPQNASGTTTGVVWNFTTGAGGALPLPAITPFPINGALSVPTTVTLTWVDGGGATTFNVYLGLTPTTLLQAQSGPGLSYDTTMGNPPPVTTPLAPGTKYYWRIDSQNAAGTTTGAVWSFTTIAAPGTVKQRFALVVGIDNYAIGSLGGMNPPLTSSVAAASATQQILLANDPGHRWDPPADVQLLTDASATKAAIRARMASMATAAVTTGSLVVFYQASYGGMSIGGISAYDAEYSAIELAQDLQAFKRGVNVVVVLDTDSAADMYLLSGASFANNIAFLAGCSSGEYPNILPQMYPNLPYNLYTSSILAACTNGLRADLNGDGQAQFYELNAYAASYVSNTVIQDTTLPSGIYFTQTPATTNDYVLRGAYTYPPDAPRTYSPPPPIYPDAPQNVVASDGTYTDGVLVTWGPDTGANVTSGTYYLVLRADNATAAPVAVSEWLSPANWLRPRTYLDRSAQPNVVYYYYVMASRSQNGNYLSPLSLPDTGWRSLDPEAYVDLSQRLPVPPLTADAEQMPFANGATPDPLARTGVPWATGYYYMSFQKNKAQGTSPTTGSLAGTVNVPKNVISPYFVYWNGGAFVPDDAFELLKGTGACTLNEFPLLTSPASPIQYTVAAQNRADGAGTFFAHPSKIKAGPSFASKYSNNVNVLREWLKADDCFVVAIPVFQSFLSYGDPTSTSTLAKIYDTDASRETLVGYHTLCVVGYDDSKQAFLAANSWDRTFWGVSTPHDPSIKGYCWISYNFVKKYGQEAWRMGFTTGRVTQQYDVTYNGALYNIHIAPPPGISFTDAHGIVITDHSANGQLKIKRKRGVPFGDALPQVTTNGGLAKLYTEAPIISLNAAGFVGSVTTRNCVVTSLKADGGFGSVNMASNPNSLWARLAQRRVMLTAGSGTAYTFHAVLDNPAFSVIQSAAAVDTHLSLSGVEIAGIDMPASNLSLSLTTKKNKIAMLPYLSVTSLTSGTANLARLTSGTVSLTGSTSSTVSIAGFTSGTVLVKSLHQLSIQGGNLHSPLIETLSGGVDSITVTGLPFSDLGGGLPVWIGGDLALDKLYAHGGAIGAITAYGGNLTANAIGADLNIGSLSARLVTLRSGKNSFPIGGKFTVGMTIAGLGQNAAESNIQSVFGSVGVTGEFIAGALPDLTPTKKGYVGTIGTDSHLPGSTSLFPLIPVIAGQSWSDQPIHFVGGDARTFVQH